MEWVEPQYSRQRVNASARALVRFFRTPEPDEDQWSTLDGHLEIVNNWRVSHNYPLNTFQTNLRYASRKVDNHPVVAQRIKRLISILAKLERSPIMKLSQMQDIGGCRAVLSSVDNVRALVDYYQNVSRIKHELGAVDDYLTHPKDSGYRGVHLIYSYVSDKKKQMYNGLKVEMQIRSRYQHAWATAVETVGTFVGQALKTSIGDADWLRMFQLMGSLIAIREKSPRVPNTPTKRRDLISHLAHYARELDVTNRLESYAHALQLLKSDVENAHWYLLELNPKEGLLIISGFKSGQQSLAETAYATAEQKARENPGTDAVLVSVESISALERAYPNYFADTSMFLELLGQALSGQSRYIRSAELKATERQMSLF